MSKTVAVFASARRHGNTGKLLDWLANELAIDVVDLTEKEIAPFDYEHKNSDDDYLPVMREILAYDNIIFVTPVYWYGPSAQMKIFIDRVTDFFVVEELKDLGRQLRNKTAYIACTSVSTNADSSFLGSLVSTFEYLGMTYGGHLHASCKNGYVEEDYRDDVDQFVKLVKTGESRVTAND